MSLSSYHKEDFDIIAFGAHPDDVELGCGGTIAKVVKEGKRVGVVDLTQGELGTRGSVSIRYQEAEKASQILGVQMRRNLKFSDGFFTNDKEHQMKVIEILRKYRPKIVLCNAIKDRHIDHAKASKLIEDACFLSGLEKIKTIDQDGTQQKAFRPSSIYHYIQWQEIEPDFVVDISDFITQKQQAVESYNSQFYDPNSKENNTPISSKNFLESIIYRAANLGRLSGVDYAEGFTCNKTLLVDSLFDLKNL